MLAELLRQLARAIQRRGDVRHRVSEAGRRGESDRDLRRELASKALTRHRKPLQHRDRTARERDRLVMRGDRRRMRRGHVEVLCRLAMIPRRLEEKAQLCRDGSRLRTIGIEDGVGDAATQRNSTGR